MDLIEGPSLNGSERGLHEIGGGDYGLIRDKVLTIFILLLDPRYRSPQPLVGG